jgi:hypothetical protein
MEQELTLERRKGSGLLGEDRRAELEANIEVSKREIGVLEQGLRARQSSMQIEIDQTNIIARLSEEKRKDAEAERERDKASTAARAAASKRMAQLKSEWAATIKLIQDAEREIQLFYGVMGEAGDIVPLNFVGADAIAKARELGDALNSLAPSKSALSDLESLQMLLLDIQRTNIDSGGRFSGLEAQAQAAVDAAERDAVAKAGAGFSEVFRDFDDMLTAMSDAATQKAAGVGGQIGDIIGGDVSGALTSILSMAGPMGAAIGGMISGLSALGEQGAGQTSKMITSFLQSIIKGLSSLPALIVKLVPSLIVDVLPDLVVALVGAIPRLVMAILIELPIAIVHGVTKWWRDLGGLKGIAKSIAEGVREWWTSTWDRIKSWLRDIFTPGDQKNAGANSRNLTDEQRAAAENVRRYGTPSGGQYAQTQAMFEASQSGGRRDRGNASTQAAPTIILQGDLTPDFVPALGRRLDRYNGPGGLRSGTTILGSN